MEGMPPNEALVTLTTYQNHLQGFLKSQCPCHVPDRLNRVEGRDSGLDWDKAPVFLKASQGLQ